MTPQEQQSIITLCLMAALVDGAKDERERAELHRIVNTFPNASSVDLQRLHDEVTARKPDLAALAGSLPPELRQPAFELAVCVCNADGAQNAEEAAFLGELRQALGLEAKPAQAFEHAATAVTSTALEPTAAPKAGSSLEEQDKMILNYAILNGALELLPQSLASMAIIPLQMKMVYRIGQAYGYQLDQNSIKDFAATAGIGLTSQIVENLGRKIIGGILGSLGGVLGSAGSQATGSAFSFVTTYALGKVAREYYAGGRTIDAAKLKQVFAAMAEEARRLQGKFTAEIRQRANGINTANIASLVRDA
ncbi:MAG: TerB family tellurite resistance protein [Burkholderiales bacterium]